MKILKVLGLGLILVLWSSCRSDFETIESTGNLEFSKDTLFLDTIFNQTGSSTYSFKVYNRTNEDLHIPSVALASGEDSFYRLNVDGVPGKSFENVEILAGDSIYVFVETTVALQEEQKEFLYQDLIQFRSKAHLQEVPLITLVKDAVFLFPEQDSEKFVEKSPFERDENAAETTLTGFYLDEQNLLFSNEKAYVIYGYAAVPSGKDLVIEAGARIHFGANSGLIVSKNSTIQVNGNYSSDSLLLEKEVIFEANRLEPDFENIPGQWGMIWLQSGSRPSNFRNTTIKNATVGLLVEGANGTSPLLQLENLQIYNSVITGLRAENANISGENVVINNSGQASLHVKGGAYDFKHATFSNYWRQSYRQFPAVYLQNFNTTDPTDLQASFSNCIIFGNENIELEYDKSEAAAFDISMSNCLIKFNSSENFSDPLYDFSNPEYYQNITLNEDPAFLNPQKNKLQLQENSAARNLGNLSTALLVPLDLLDNNRTTEPDLGAYEWKAAVNDKN